MLGLYTPPTGFHFMVRMVDSPVVRMVDSPVANKVDTSRKTSKEDFRSEAMKKVE